MFDLFKELSKPDPENERRRLNLMNRIQERMARDHERDELFYNYAMNDLYNDYKYIQSLPNSCPQKASLKIILEIFMKFIIIIEMNEMNYIII